MKKRFNIFFIALVIVCVCVVAFGLSERDVFGVDRDAVVDAFNLINDNESDSEVSNAGDFLIKHQFNIFVVIFIISGIILAVMGYVNRRLTRMIDYDKLTGLMSKSKFADEVRKLVENAEPKEYVFIVFDIDKLKDINNIYGHEVGDELLKVISESILNAVSPGSLVGRLVNDSFGILTKYYESINMKTDHSINDKISAIGIEIPVYFSAGLYVIEDTTETVFAIADNANIAKRISKDVFGNSMCFFTKKLRAEKEREHLILNTMERAIIDKEFYIQVQPKVELRTGKLVGGEVLVRWSRQDGINISPEVYIPLFERCGFINKLDKYVFNEACKFISESDVIFPTLSVNVSPVTVAEKNFIDGYLEILEKWGLKPTQFELEFTETALNKVFEGSIAFIDELRLLGFKLSIDDFGKDASTLARIKRLNIDTLKLDKEFLDGEDEGGKSEIVLSNIISMANDLGIITLAEGIETEEQRAMLLNLGCELGQGYLFDKPLSEGAYIQRIQEADDIKLSPVIANKKANPYLAKYGNLPYGVATIANNECGTIIRANREFYNIIGYSRSNFKHMCNDQMVEIMFDRLYPRLCENLKNKHYNFSYDARIKKMNNETIWVHFIFEYNIDNDTLSCIMIDITNNNRGIYDDEEYKKYCIEKEISYYFNDLTSEYIFVSNIETDEIEYVNRNVKQFLERKNLAQWKGKTYYQVMLGCDECTDPEFYDSAEPDKFITKEYYNEYLDVYVLVQVKLILINGVYMRLHITRDASHDYKMRNELAFQRILLGCLEELYKNNNKTVAVTQMLTYIKDFYGGVSAYYFDIDSDFTSIREIFATIGENAIDMSSKFNSLTNEEIYRLVELFKDKGVQCTTNAQMLKKGLSPDTADIFKANDDTKLLIMPILNDEQCLMGFGVVQAPKVNISNTQLTPLLARFIQMFDNNEELRGLSHDAIIEEESSKTNIIDVCIKTLQFHSEVSSSVNDILRLVCRHYGASFCAIISVADKIGEAKVEYEYYDKPKSLKLFNYGAHPRELVDILSEAFKCENVNPVLKLSEEKVISSQVREYWHEQGFYEGYFTPIYDYDNEIESIIVAGNPKLKKRSLALLQVFSKFMFDYSDKISLKASHKEQLARDLLTNLYNKVSTEDKIEGLIKDDCTGVMLMVDIDNFKLVNDTFGHQAGDDVIVSVSKVLKSHFRAYDIIGRIGGDEFMVYCENLVDIEQIEIKAQAIIDDFGAEFSRTYGLENVSLSIGIKLKDENCNTFEILYSKADEALYRAKRKGKNQYSF